jgi:hypothetical protein
MEFKNLSIYRAETLSSCSAMCLISFSVRALVISVGLIMNRRGLLNFYNLILIKNSTMKLVSKVEWGLFEAFQYVIPIVGTQRKQHNPCDQVLHGPIILVSWWRVQVKLCLMVRMFVLVTSITNLIWMWSASLVCRTLILLHPQIRWCLFVMILPNEIVYQSQPTPKTLISRYRHQIWLHSGVLSFGQEA